MRHLFMLPSASRVSRPVVTFVLRSARALPAPVPAPRAVCAAATRLARTLARYPRCRTALLHLYKWAVVASIPLVLLGAWTEATTRAAAERALFQDLLAFSLFFAPLPYALLAAVTVGCIEARLARATTP